MDTILFPHSLHLEDGGVGERVDVAFDDQGDIENGLAVRFVPARKRPARIDRLELRRGDGLGLPLGIGEGGAVEAPQFVIQRSGESAGQEAWAGWKLRRGTEHHLLQLVAEGDGAAEGRACLRAHFGVADGQVSGIEHDLGDSFVDHGLDLHRSREAGRTDVGLYLQPVDEGLNGPGQPERVDGGRGRIGRVGRHRGKATRRAPSRFSLRARQ